MDKIYSVVLQPVITALFLTAFLIFVWGLVGFIRDKDSDAGRSTGKRHILWGIVGMVIMVSVFGIINIIAGTIGAGIPAHNRQIETDVNKIDVKSDL